VNIDGNCHFVQAAGSRDRRCRSTCGAIRGRFSGREDTGTPAGMARYEMGISAKTLENGDRVPAAVRQEITGMPSILVEGERDGIAHPHDHPIDTRAAPVEQDLRPGPELVIVGPSGRFAAPARRWRHRNRGPRSECRGGPVGFTAIQRVDREDAAPRHGPGGRYPDHSLLSHSGIRRARSDRAAPDATAQRSAGRASKS
jgi:hypothetical protein